MTETFQFLDSSLPGVLNNLRAPGAANIIFAADAAGAILAGRLASRGISVAAFCDNSPAKIGTRLAGLPVLAPAEAARLHPEAHFFIALTSVNWVREQLVSLGVYNALSIHAGALAPPVPVEATTWRDEDRHRFDLVFRAQDFFIHLNKSPSGRHPFDRVELAITERCSLRCRDCCNFMQYFKHPISYPVSDLLDTIDRIAAVAADPMEMFHIIGGEPLMHPDFHLVAAHAASIPKIRKVKVLTNATLLPKPEQIEFLKPAGAKLSFKITDYGDLSRQREKLVELLDKNGIDWEIIHHGNWRRMAGIEKRGESRESLTRILYQCPVGSFCHTVVNGRLFRCPFAAHATTLKAIADRPDGSVDLRLADRPENLEALRQRVGEYLSRQEVLEACDSCPYGLPASDVPAALQAAAPLAYREAAE